MTAPQDVQQFIGRTAVGSDGSKIGDVGQVYLDEQTGQPLWVTVTTGMFGTWQSFAPIGGSRLDGDQVVLAVSKDLVKDAPNIDDDGRIDEGEQDALYQHYTGYLGDGARPAARTPSIGARTTRPVAAGTGPVSRACRAGTPPGRPPMMR